MGLLDRFRKPKAPTADDLYGTGLWRQHRDRFNRAVDRFYDTALAVHREHPAESAGTGPAAGANATPAAPGAPAPEPPAETLAQLTHTLGEASAAVDAVAQAAQESFPIEGMVLPAPARARVGRLPELLSRAAAKVAEAAQAAAMSRVALRTGGDGLEAAAAAHRYVADAAELVGQCSAIASGWDENSEPLNS
ncbi:hypothetical protein NQ038_00135 [Brevibacterium sp. 50QC2O2]|uniref:hypothetical protein n=1 Tax=Brevibacterium sp. 50QC2O2 TaxID=2968459 RepID=UPI00211CD30A|nr:hypothetical protein [Brevibacterium sp. 50QC2O2]MCQ9387071.1 hypothetical protein [Brevibacterium sp. 50QC2O2]